MSASTRIELSQGVVLHHYPYRDSSVILEVFTREHGRLGIIARGVRSQKSRIRSDVQPFRQLRLSWNMRGELGTLTHIETTRSYPQPQIPALYSAYYLNELMMRLLARHDPHPVLFDTYIETLTALFEHQAVEPRLRYFEKCLLEELGYGLVLDVDVETGEALDPDRYYEYRFEHGPVAAREGHTGVVFQGSHLLAIAANTFQRDDVLSDAKRLMRYILSGYLGDKPLKTRELFRQLN
ncbi:MAG: DNA repair protein RecO [Gammaproteobacteria bacterium]